MRIKNVGESIKTLFLFFVKERKKEPAVKKLNQRSQISRDYPLNLSILISGGKETN